MDIDLHLTQTEALRLQLALIHACLATTSKVTRRKYSELLDEVNRQYKLQREPEQLPLFCQEQAL